MKLTPHFEHLEKIVIFEKSMRPMNRFVYPQNYNDDEPHDSDQDCDGEEDDSVQECHSVGSSSFDSDSLRETDNEFALPNIVGFVWVLDLRRCHDGVSDDMFQRVGQFVRYDGLDSREKETGINRQIMLVGLDGILSSNSLKADFRPEDGQGTCLVHVDAYRSSMT